MKSKWEDRIFARIVAFIGCAFGMFVGVLFVARAPGPFKIAGSLIAIASVYGFIKLMRVIRKMKNK